MSAVGLLLAVLVGAACGSDSTSKPVAEGASLVVPALFEPTGFGYAAVSSTATHLVGLGGLAPSFDGTYEVRFGGEAVELLSGAVTEIGRLTLSGQPVDVLVSASDDDQVIIFGQTCEENTEGSHCEPSTIAAAFLDPVLGEWIITPLPEEVAGKRLGDTPWVQVTRNGSFVGVVTVNDGRKNRSWLLTRDGEHWRVVREIDTWKTVKAECSTEKAMYVLHAEPISPLDTGDGPDGLIVRFSLTEIQLDTGNAHEIDVPPLAPVFGGAGVAMGCGPEDLVVASGAPGYEAIVLAFDRDGWSRVPDVLIGHRVVPGEVKSGTRGVLVGGYFSTAENLKAYIYAAVDGSGNVRHLDPDRFVGASRTWVGTSGTAILIGPGVGPDGSVKAWKEEVFQ